MSNKSILLGVNVDHIATIRQARGTNYPCPVEGAKLAERAGADGITAHLREDRRHIQDHDILRLKQQIATRLNLEMAVTDEMIDFALTVNPAHCCLVPEKREELTTEGGLDVKGQFEKISRANKLLAEAGIEVSLFIDPDLDQIKAAVDSGAPAIEIHTGEYAENPSENTLSRIIQAAHYADELGLIVNAGHGLTVDNVREIAKISVIHELNIGHALVADSIMLGIEQAVRRMKKAMEEARR